MGLHFRCVQSVLSKSDHIVTNSFLPPVRNWRPKRCNQRRKEGTACAPAALAYFPVTVTFLAAKSSKHAIESRPGLAAAGKKAAAM